MPNQSRLDLRLEPELAARLYELECELLGEGMKANRQTIVKALIWGTSAAQTNGMVLAFNRQQCAWEEADATS